MRGGLFILFVAMLIVLSWVMSACAPRVVVKERVEQVSVPVAVGCVSGPRPDAVLPLSAQFAEAEWKALSHQQKTALVSRQGQRHQSRAEGIDAATGACR